MMPKEFRRGKPKLEVEYHEASYTNFYKYIYCLEELRLIKRAERQYGLARIPRQYYEVTIGDDSELWNSLLWKWPQEALYPLASGGVYYECKRWSDIENISMIDAFIKYFPEVLEELEREFVKLQKELGPVFREGFSDEVARWLEKRKIDVDWISENLREYGRTLPPRRKPKVLPEVSELQRRVWELELELSSCKKELEELRAARKPPVRAPPPPPKAEKKPPKKPKPKVRPTPKHLAPAVQTVILALRDLKRGRVDTFLEELETVERVVESWDEVGPADKEEICKLVREVPDTMWHFLVYYPKVEEQEKIVKSLLRQCK